MTAATLATRRAAVVERLADEVIAEEDEVERRRAEAAAAERAAEKQRLELSSRRDALAEERIEALTEAEKHCRAMIKAMGRVLQLGADAGGVYGALGERPPPGQACESAMRMLGERLSAALKTLTKNGSRFGSLMLARTWRQPDQSWTEEAITPVRRTEQENREDD